MGEVGPLLFARSEQNSQPRVEDLGLFVRRRWLISLVSRWALNFLTNKINLTIILENWRALII